MDSDSRRKAVKSVWNLLTNTFIRMFLLQVLSVITLAHVIYAFVNSGGNELQYSTNSLRNRGSLYPFSGAPPDSRVYHSISCCIGDLALVYGGKFIFPILFSN